MPPVRHFLGWSEPPPRLVARWLLQHASSPGGDLGDWLVLAPTRQAGRRLREALAREAGAQGRAVLPPQIRTPPVFWSSAASPERAAGPLLENALWEALLGSLKPALRAAIFPAWPDGIPAAQIPGCAAMLQQLRASLAEAGLTVADAARREPLSNDPRWEALAELEDLYQQRLGKLDLEDAASRELRLAAAPELPDGVRCVALAALPDPTPLLLRALEAAAGRAEIHALIHAPAELAEGFDDHGRPLPAFWTTRAIDIPDEPRNLRLVADLGDQAALTRTLLLEENGREAVIGINDPAILPHLRDALRAAGAGLHDPAGSPARNHALVTLARRLAGLAQDDTWAAVRDLARHGACLASLESRHPDGSTAFLAALDEFHEDHLPARLEDALSLLPAASGDSDAVREFLLQARAWRDALRGAQPLEALIGILRDLHAGQSLAADTPAHDHFQLLARTLLDAREEWNRPAWALLAADPAQRLAWTLDAWEETRLASEPADPSIDAEGWLELAWHPAPVVVVTCAHEGVLPSGRLSDPFLPDQARERLGLRSDRTRFARDACLLSALLAARRDGGRVALLCSRAVSDGDPARPSRLLFRCPDDRLVARAKRLFAAPESLSRALPPSAAFRLHPAVLPELRAPERLRVTDFSSYLASPFLFFCRNLLGMGEAGDESRELDALAFGSLAHACLGKLHGMPENDLGDADKVRSLLESSLEEALRRRYGRKPSLAVQFQRESLRQRLGALARLQADWHREGWRIHKAEASINLVIDGVAVSGRVDRVDVHPKRRAARILDYKTGESPAAPADKHLLSTRAAGILPLAITPDGKRAWQDLQLPLYHAAAAKLEIPPEYTLALGYVNLPAATGETALILWEEFDDTLAKDALRCAEAVVKAIRDHRYEEWGRPSEHELASLDTLTGGDPGEAFDLSAFSAWLEKQRT